MSKNYHWFDLSGYENQLYKIVIQMSSVSFKNNTIWGAISNHYQLDVSENQSSYYQDHDINQHKWIPFGKLDIIQENGIIIFKNIYGTQTQASELSSSGSFVLYDRFKWTSGYLHFRVQIRKNVTFISIIFGYRHPNNYYQWILNLDSSGMVIQQSLKFVNKTLYSSTSIFAIDGTTDINLHLRVIKTPSTIQVQGFLNYQETFQYNQSKYQFIYHGGYTGVGLGGPDCVLELRQMERLRTTLNSW